MRRHRRGWTKAKTRNGREDRTGNSRAVGEICGAYNADNSTVCNKADRVGKRRYAKSRFESNAEIYLEAALQPSSRGSYCAGTKAMSQVAR
jgi:hypothetical protein